MEDILKQINESIAGLRQDSAADLDTRKSAHNGHMALLDTLMNRLRSIQDTYRTEVKNLIDEKASLDKELAFLRETIVKETKAYEMKVSQLKVQSDNLDRDISDKEIRSKGLDTRIDSLTSEMKITEPILSSLRGNVSQMERASNDLTRSEKALTDSIVKKKQEESALDSSMANKRAEFTRLSSEVALLESRK